MSERVPEGGFGEYRALILSELRRVSDKIDVLDGKLSNLQSGEISNLKVELSTIKTKVVIMSAAAAAIASAIVAAVVSHFSR